MALSALTPERGAAWLRAALDNVRREYPNAPQLALSSPEDLRPTREVHPAFYGSLDWHSAVHMHWSVARLARRLPELPESEEARGALADHLVPGALEREAAYLRDHPGFERAYGWGWALALRAELADEPETAPLADAMAPLTEAVVDLWAAYLPASPYPNRPGTHPNTAFAMILAWHAAGRLDDDRLRDLVDRHGRRYFLRDRAAPAAYEPSAEDFLSPSLTEAHLVGLLLPPDEFGGWLEGFLPGLERVIPPALRDPVEIDDRGDWRLNHLHGLNLSRAWSWRALARALPRRDERRVAALDAADRHLAAGLDHVLTGGYHGDHWLISFALLALDGIDPA